MLIAHEDAAARNCACHAMSGMGANSWETLSFDRPSPLSPPPYTPISTELPHALKVGAGTVLAPPEPTVIPVKKPIDWGGIFGGANKLFNQYTDIDDMRNVTKDLQAEAARKERLSALTVQSAEAKARAAAAQSGVAPMKQGMGTGTKVAIGAGVAVAAIVAFKVFG